MSEVQGNGSSASVEYYIRGYQDEGGRWAPAPEHRGRTVSWLGVGLILAGSAAIGIGMVLGAVWLWVLGLVAAVVGGALCAVTDIFLDVVLDEPRKHSEEPHATPLHRIKDRDKAVASASSAAAR